MIAALYVLKDGPYFNLPGIDPWDESRDARTYTGPHKVIAHPPCERWGRYAGITQGQDEGCFESALKSVRAFGGLLEHPEGSHAFRTFDLPIPAWHGGWSEPDAHGGRSCCVAQGHYGHRARKMTWLYAINVHFKELSWGPTAMRDLSHLSETARKRAIKTGICQRLSKRQRKVTPDEFRDLLITIVKGSPA